MDSPGNGKGNKRAENQLLHRGSPGEGSAFLRRALSVHLMHFELANSVFPVRWTSLIAST
jgi:hypothetical protein